MDFALKVVQWSESETVRLQLWDIAGILKVFEVLSVLAFFAFLSSFFSPFLFLFYFYSFCSKNKFQEPVDSRARTALLCRAASSLL